MSPFSILLPLGVLVAFAGGWWWRHKKAIAAGATREHDARDLRDELSAVELERNTLRTEVEALQRRARTPVTTPLDGPSSSPPALPFDASGIRPSESEIPTVIAEEPVAKEPASDEEKTEVLPKSKLASRGSAPANEQELRSLKAAVERERAAKVAAASERDELQKALATEQARRVVDAKSRDTIEKTLRQTKAKLEDAKRELFEERRAHGETHAALDDRGQAMATLQDAADGQNDNVAVGPGYAELEDTRDDLAAARSALIQAKVEVNEARSEAERLRGEHKSLLADMEAVKAGYAQYERELADALSAQKAAAQNAPDDLTKIKGVGQKLAATLHDQGITTFAEIAGWSDDDVAEVAERIGRFGKRVVRDDWRAQARALEDKKNSAAS